MLDTTVLLYAVGSEHALRAPCRALVLRIREGRLAATTTPEVIQEFTHVRARRHGRAEAVARARDCSSLLDPLLVVDGAMLSLGLRLFEETPAIGSFDAIVCAAAITRGAEAVVSADKAFGTVAGLTHIDPASADFDRWLARFDPD